MDISIIIPTYNRNDKLKSCLESLLGQDYPLDKVEIVVVDDGLNRSTRDMVVNGFSKKLPHLSYMSQPHKGPAAARNLGVRACRGKLIGFIDDDCTVSAGWIRSMVEAHRENPQITAVGGLTLTATQKTSVLVSQFLANCSIETRINGKKEAIFFPTCNVSLKRHAFERYRFNEDFPLPGGEDLEFFWRLFKEGHRFKWDTGITAVHCRDDSLRSFLRQAHAYGRGNFFVQSLHNDHPFLHEFRTGPVSFWRATLVNSVKIPRFSYLLGRRLIREGAIRTVSKKASVYAYFIVHKVFYLLGNIREFIRLKTRGSRGRARAHDVPRLLILDITHACNLSCRVCDIWKTAAHEANMQAVYIHRLLSQAKKLGIPQIALSGGEPLLREDIFDIFDYARELGIQDLGVLTNGIAVEGHMQRLKPYLLDNTVSLVLSLDSLDPQTHNYIRNSDMAWQQTIKSLELLSLLKKECPRVHFNVITIVLNKNLGELSGIAGFVKNLGADSLQFQPLLSNNLRMEERTDSALFVEKERLPLLDEAIDALLALKEKDPGFIKNSGQNLSLIKRYYRGTLSADMAPCLSARQTVLVSNLGECTTCFSGYGDIKKHDLRHILGGDTIVKAREAVGKCRWPCLLPCFCDHT